MRRVRSESAIYVARTALLRVRARRSAHAFVTALRRRRYAASVARRRRYAACVMNLDDRGPLFSRLSPRRGGEGTARRALGRGVATDF